MVIYATHGLWAANRRTERAVLARRLKWVAVDIVAAMCVADIAQRYVRTGRVIRCVYTSRRHLEWIVDYVSSRSCNSQQRYQLRSACTGRTCITRLYIVMYTLCGMECAFCDLVPHFGWWLHCSVLVVVFACFTCVSLVRINVYAPRRLVAACLLQGSVQGASLWLR